MAWATTYYYNRNKYQVAVRCTSGLTTKTYYLPPRAYSYVKEELAAGFTLPTNVLTFDVPVWWKEYMWPWTKPWNAQP